MAKPKASITDFDSAVMVGSTADMDDLLDLLGRAKLALLAAPNNFGATNGGALSVIADIDKTRAKYGR